MCIQDLGMWSGWILVLPTFHHMNLPSFHLWTATSCPFDCSGVVLKPVLEKLYLRSRHTLGLLTNHQSNEYLSSENHKCLHWISFQDWIYIYIYKNIEHVRILSVLYPRGTINVFSQPMIEQSRNDLMQELTPFLTEFDLWRTQSDKIFRDQISTLWNKKQEIKKSCFRRYHI